MRLQGLLGLLVGLALSCQGMAAEPSFALGGGLGVTQLGEDLYLSTSVYPDVAVGKLGVGLELTVNIGADGVRREDWDSISKVLARSVRYLRWANKGEPLYLQLGTLYDAEIGTGILVDSYANRSATDIASGDRRLGLAMDVDLRVGGVEAILGDALHPGLTAGRVYLRPTSFGSSLGLIDKLSVGVSVAKDNRSDDPYNSLSATAVDLYLPLHRMANLYAHAATVQGHGSGEGVGLKGDMGPIAYRAELRRLDADFVATPFSKAYEDNGVDWDKRPVDGVSTVGYLLGADISLLNGSLVGSVRQESSFAEGTSSPPRLTGSLTATGGLLKTIAGGRDAAVEASYTKEVADPASGGADGYLRAGATVALLRGVNLSYEYNAVYPHQGEARHSMTTGLRFGLW